MRVKEGQDGNRSRMPFIRVYACRIQYELMINAVQWLPIEMSHCAELTKLPFHHRDPFDRMLTAQARVEDLLLLSRDKRLSAYGIERLW